jgi:hypothetical protein
MVAGRESERRGLVTFQEGPFLLKKHQPLK